jgi:hypothetical protein
LGGRGHVVKKLVVTALILIGSACMATACEPLSGSAVSTEATLAGGETADGSVATTAAVPAADMVAVSGSEASFGQALDFGGMVIRVDTPIEDTTATPTEGNRPWAALVTIQNNRSAEFLYNPLDYHFIDSGGNSYEAIGATMLQMLSTGILAPGAQVQAYIVMELPSSTTPVQIRFEPYIPMEEKWVGIWG